MSYPPHGTAIDTIIADMDTRIHTLETTPAVPVDLTLLTGRVVALEEADEVMADAITATMEGVQTDIGTVTGRVIAAEQAISSLAGGVADLATTGSYMDERLDAHGLRLDQHDTALATTASVLELHGSELAGLAGAIDQHDNRLLTHGSRLDALETDMASIVPRVVGLEAGIADVAASITAVQARVTALESAPGGGAAGVWPGYLSVEQFAGATATEKFRAALTYAASASSGRIPAIVLPPGTVLAPGGSPFMLFNGAGVVGGVVPETEFSGRQRVTVSGAAPNGVFDHPNDARDIVIANIGWEGPGSSQVCRFFADNTNRLCYSLFHGVSFDNFTSVLRKRFLGFDWTGTGYCNNSTETPFEFSGSDWKVFMDGYYLDSPNLADDEYLLHIKSGNKAVVGSVFVTGDGPTPVRVSGGQMVRIMNLEMEAEGVPRKTAGAGLFVSGGNVIVDNAWFFRTMYNPAGTGRGDLGVIHVEGAGTLVRVKHATFGEYNTTPEKPGGHVENHVYAGGSSKVYLDVASPWNMQANSGLGGTMNARPLQVQKAGTGAISVSAYTSL